MFSNIICLFQIYATKHPPAALRAFALPVLTNSQTYVLGC